MLANPAASSGEYADGESIVNVWKGFEWFFQKIHHPMDGIYGM